MNADDIRSKIRSYVLAEFLEESDADSLGDDTPLVSSGVVNSLALVALRHFFKTEFGVDLRHDEVTVAHVDTINRMVDAVTSRLQGNG
jgi:acyl carrier protein